MHEQKTPIQWNGSKQPKTSKTSKNPLVQNFWKIWWKCRNKCKLNKKRRGKKALLGVEEENPWSFDSKKTQKKYKKTKRNQEGSKRKRKNNEEHCSDSFYF